VIVSVSDGEKGWSDKVSECAYLPGRNAVRVEVDSPRSRESMACVCVDVLQCVYGFSSSVESPCGGDECSA
jgi:hypothetical protein